MRLFWLFIGFLFIGVSVAFSQEELEEEIKDVELSIPSSPAFALLGVNPEIVTRPSDLKSFKVDWRLKNYALAPDLAIEAQPFWHFYYRNKSLKEYARLSNFQKKLSTVSFSFGTAKIDGLNHAALAVKANLYAENDPVTDKRLVKSMMNEYQESTGEIQVQLDSLQALRRNTLDSEERRAIQAELDELKEQKDFLENSTKDRYRDVIEEYALENWNRTMLDAAFGMVYTYDNLGQDSLKVERSGFSFWLNGCLRMGDHGLLGGIFKYTQIADASNKLFGVSYRYGGPRFNFFVELAYENLGNYFDETQELPFSEDEIFQGSFSEDLGAGFFNFNNEEKINQYTIAYGGDFKLSRNILLNFALRTKFTSEFKLERLIPVANVVCLMK